MGLPDPDPSINWQKVSIRKTFTVFLLFCACFLTFIYESDVNVPSKSIKQKYFLLASCQPPVEKNQDQDPEVSGTDPRIRTRTEMSRIHSTALKSDRTSVIFVQHLYLNKRKNCVMKEKTSPLLAQPSLQYEGRCFPRKIKTFTIKILPKKEFFMLFYVFYGTGKNNKYRVPNAGC